MYNIEIFLGNKLVSCDTTVPLMQSIKNHIPNVKINYHIFDLKSFNDIKKNVFLYDCLCKTGSLKLRGSSFSKNYLVKAFLKIKTFLFLLTLIYKLIFKKTVFYHFGLISYWPFKLIQKINKNRVFVMEANCWFKHENIYILNNMEYKRPTDKEEKMDDTKNIIYFNDVFLDLFTLQNKTLIKLQNPRMFDSWYQYVKSHGNQYLENEFKNKGINYKEGYFLYLTGHIGYLPYMKDDTSIEECIKTTLATLSKYGNNLPIIIKPHSITNMSIFNKIIKEMNLKNIHVSYLHPAVLSSHAICAISNYFSSSQADANFIGTSTIEFTNYSKKALELSNNNSANPPYIDYFINNDDEKLANIIVNLLKSNFKNRSVKTIDDKFKNLEFKKSISRILF